MVGPIRNYAALLEHGRLGPRSLALRLAARGLEACDPGAAVERTVSLDGDQLTVGGRKYTLHPGGRVLVLGSGKASLAIAAALERVLGERLEGGLVVVRHAEGPPLERIRVLEASHPLPDARSHDAAKRLLETASHLTDRDLLIACFTGGSSALTSLPPASVPHEHKQQLHKQLLASGMPIADVNVVRKQVSEFKGGRLAAAALPAQVVNLTVSDVAGDPIDAITDPTVANTTGIADAIAVLRDWALWDEIPGTIRDHLSGPADPPPDLREADIQTELLITGEAACEAMKAEALAAGVDATVLGTGIEDEAASVGRILGQIAAESAAFGRPFGAPHVLVGCGGESTVRLGPQDSFGDGGPNREAALAAATRFAGLDVAAVFLDTDGADGGGPAAGGIACGDTLERAGIEHVDIRGALARHRSGDAMEALGDAIDTGPTHTNVNDMFVIAIGGASDG
jgi:glycerate 2-kinase